MLRTERMDRIQRLGLLVGALRRVRPERRKYHIRTFITRRLLE